MTTTTHVPVPRDERDPAVYFGVVLSGAVFFNAIVPKLRMAGWHAIDPMSTVAQKGSCACCQSEAIALVIWKGPDYPRDKKQWREFFLCMECFHFVELHDVMPGEMRPPEAVYDFDDCPLFETCPPDDEPDGQR
jgi:hypothetical protein